MKLGLRPEGCGFEAYIKGCVFQSRRQLSQGQLGGVVRRETAVTDPAELTLQQNRASTETMSLQRAIKGLTC